MKTNSCWTFSSTENPNGSPEEPRLCCTLNPFDRCTKCNIAYCVECVNQWYEGFENKPNHSWTRVITGTFPIAVQPKIRFADFNFRKYDLFKRNDE